MHLETHATPGVAHSFSEASHNGLMLNLDVEAKMLSFRKDKSCAPDDLELAPHNGLRLNLKVEIKMFFRKDKSATR